MVWTSWANRVNALPEVLAGPILRRVEPSSATVWLAMRRPRTVTLRVFDGASNEVLVGFRTPVTLAPNLHVVAVTASAPASTLGPGQVYSYELYFQDASGVAPTSAPSLTSPGILRSASGIGPQSVAYPGFTRPTFAMPPADLNDVRLIHGSCRKPHGQGRDALSTVNGMIATTASNARRRPHQLFLTGDQIYADDVAAALLFMLIDAGAALGFPAEALPGGPAPRPSERSAYVASGGITADGAVTSSHLVTLAEYCCMYLFAWSDVLWQSNDFPDYEQVTGRPRGPRVGNTPFGLYQQDVARLRVYRQTVNDVRRALANVPTYMAFDDHEVTDDWFLDRGWVDQSVSNPLLQRIVQNGVTGYALFQGWGNAPERFENNNSGAQLLSAVAAWIQAPSAGSGAALRGSLGLPLAVIPAGLESYARAANAMDWHYVVRGPGYQVLVLDSRTQRGYPTGGPHNHPGLVSNSSLADQTFLLQTPGAEDVVIVVAPGPVIGLAALEAYQLLQSDSYPLDVEFWNARPLTFERLLSRLAGAADASGGIKHARVVLLSGDVHYGFSARVRYRATAPFAQPAANTEAVFAQFTASAFKNQDDKTLGLHEHPIVVAVVTLQSATRYGWNNATGQGYILGGDLDGLILRRGSPIIYEKSDSFVPAFPGSSPFAPAPDWRYRIDFIRSDDERDRDVPAPPTRPVPFPPPGDRDAALQAYLNALGNHASYRGFWGSGKEIVGQNNVGELSFQWGAGDDKVVTQELWWWLDTSANPFPVSRYRCDFALRDEPI